MPKSERGGGAARRARQTREQKLPQGVRLRRTLRGSRINHASCCGDGKAPEKEVVVSL